MQLMKILILSDNYPPEMNANARIISELSQLWAQHNQPISVITSQPNFPMGKIFDGYKNTWYVKSIMNGVKVIRVKTYIYPNKGLVRRTLDFISFGLSSFFFGLFKQTDIIIGITPQFFCALSACFLSIIKKKPFALILCDLWPDSIAAHGIIKKKFFFKLLKKIEIWMYHRCNLIIILSEHFKSYLNTLGIADPKIIVSISGASKQFYPREKNQKILNDYHLLNKFVVGYIGTFGIAHNHHDLLLIAASLRKQDNCRVSFFMLGDGAKRADLIRQKNENTLDNIVIDGPFSGTLIPDYWSVIDLAIIPLAEVETNKTVLPSKLLEAMSMGIPVLLYAPDGAAKKFLDQSQAGWYIPAGDVAALENLIIQLSSNDALLADKKDKAVAFAKNFTREQQANDLFTHLTTLERAHQ